MKKYFNMNILVWWDAGAWFEGKCMQEQTRWYEDWGFKIRGRDVTVRVSVESPGRGEVIAVHVIYGPSQTGLSIPVASQQDAKEKTEALLCDLMGSSWC
ncbi:hypothetical protein [Stenotrophomonas maltophilia]|uniref:hypothetical protein n=1 Tax=Stenotrophomonas maltophilia TaxID=40324 RepID=UPI001E64FA8D|nr:hypothetical protein [Stenotrophomonas maltophilia]